jgi:hypothetical protein
MNLVASLLHAGCRSLQKLSDGGLPSTRPLEIFSDILQLLHRMPVCDVLHNMLFVMTFHFRQFLFVYGTAIGLMSFKTRLNI